MHNLLLEREDGESRAAIFFTVSNYFNGRRTIAHIMLLWLQVAREIKIEKGGSPALVTGDVGYVDCIAVSISPDLGERISLSAERPLIEEVCVLTF